MYKTKEQLKKEVKTNNEGKEKMFLTGLADFDKKNPKIKLFAHVELKPGEEVSYHMHVGEAETYYILSGHGEYNDNGTKMEIFPGTVTYTPSKTGHAIKNTGSEMLEFIALILFD